MPQFDMPALEEVLCDAIVRRFFEPEVVGVQWVPGTWIDGRQQMTPVPQHSEAPLVTVVREMYRENIKDLAERIWARIDVDDLADRIAVKCVDELFAGPSDTWSTVVTEAPQVKAVKDAVHAQVAAELTRRALAKLDAPDTSEDKA